MVEKLKNILSTGLKMRITEKMKVCFGDDGEKGKYEMKT
jgi:hypothetical protein